jgi:hypothetical protein
MASGNRDSEGRPARRFDGLARQTEQARAQSERAWSETMKVAEAVATTEEAVAATLRRMAQHHPEHADRLMSMSDAASKYAEHDRTWLRERRAAASRRGRKNMGAEGAEPRS